MTDAKKITNLEAMQQINAICDTDEFAAIADELGFDFEALAAKIAHMTDVAEKRAAAPKKPTKAQKENQQMALEAVKKMLALGEPVGTKWIMENVKGVMKPQKATAIMTVAIANGWATKATPVKGAARWEAIIPDQA